MRLLTPRKRDPIQPIDISSLTLGLHSLHRIHSLVPSLGDAAPLPLAEGVAVNRLPGHLVGLR